MASHPIPKFGLAIDFETTGYSLPHYAERHQGVSFGALIFDIERLTVVDTLYCEIKYDPKYAWEDTAEKIHGLTRDYLSKHGVTQAEAAEQLALMVHKYMGTENVVVLGHRPHFDIAFLDQLFDSIGFAFKYDPIKLDTAAFGLVMLGMTKSDDLFDAVGLPPRGKHDALEDIIYTLESLRQIRDYFLTGLAVSASS
jgi:DNA polymerase III epsilon subunit-like protein